MGAGSLVDGLRARSRERAKLEVRKVLHRRALDLIADPYPRRVATTLRWLVADTVLDVGANIGQYATALRSSGYSAAIVSCEPLPDAYEQLARRSASDPLWTAIRTAVGDTSGTITINVAGNSYSSSVLPMTDAHREAAPESAFVGAVEAPITTIEALIGAQQIDPARTLLKVDTQGFERQVLDGAGDLLGSFAAVQLELSFVPLYDGQDLFDDLVGRMRAAGFTLYGLDPGISSPETGRTLQCDGLFVQSRALAGP